MSKTRCAVRWASVDLLRQTGETLAGRIAYIDLAPLAFVKMGLLLFDKQIDEKVKHNYNAPG